MLVRRYLAREIYRATLLVLGVLVGLFSFFSLLDLINDVNSTFTIWRLLQLELIQIPTRMYDLLPVALLIGSVSALASMANRSELIIYRVCGISGARLVGMLWWATLPIILLSAVLSEFVTPHAELATTRYSVQYLGESLSNSSLYSGYWFREQTPDHQQRILNIQQLDGHDQLHGVTVYRFNPDYGVFVSMQQAKLGYFQEGRLVLRDVDEVRSSINPKQLSERLAPLVEGKELITSIPELREPGAIYTHYAEVRLPSTLNAQRVYASQMQADRMDTLTLLDYIHYLKSNHLQINREVIALWRKLSYPFTLLVMVLLAAPIGFIHTRKGGMGLKVFIGILFGVVFFMFNQLSLSVGVLDNIPPWAAAVLPNVLAAVLAFLALYRIEVLSMQRRTHQSFKERSHDA